MVISVFPFDFSAANMNFGAQKARLPTTNDTQVVPIVAQTKLFLFTTQQINILLEEISVKTKIRLD